MMNRFCPVPFFVLSFFAAGFAAETPPPSPVTWESRCLEPRFYSEGGAMADYNKDGKMDLASGPWWYEGPEFTKKHQIYASQDFDPKGYSANFFAFAHDMDGDGWQDVMVLGFPGKESWWYKNPQGKEGDWSQHEFAKKIDNESPDFTDINGDKKPEVICSKDGIFGYFSPDWAKPEQSWNFTAISPGGVAGGQYTHGLGKGDVNKDGRMDLLEKNTWWEQGTEAGKEWTPHRFQFSGGGGSQMHVEDFDNDGRNDIVTALNAHGYGLAWYQNTLKDNEVVWVRHDIMGDKPEQNPYGVAFSQLHALEVADVDGDGVKDLITGKRWWAHASGDPGVNEPAVLYWFKTVRGQDGVKFIPYQIHGDSGVGTQLPMGDLNGDGLVDFATTSKKGTWIHLQKRAK